MFYGKLKVKGEDRIYTLTGVIDFEAFSSAEDLCTRIEDVKTDFTPEFISKAEVSLYEVVTDYINDYDCREYCSDYIWNTDDYESVYADYRAILEKSDTMDWDLIQKILENSLADTVREAMEVAENAEFIDGDYEDLAKEFYHDSYYDEVFEDYINWEGMGEDLVYDTPSGYTIFEVSDGFVVIED